VAPVSDLISLRGMRFMGRHGVGDEERATAQPFEVDLLLHLDLVHASVSDELSDTVDYSAAFDLVRSVVEGRSFRLLEALAEAIARAVLDAFAVDEVEVAVRKPQAPLPGHFETVEVRIRRGRIRGATG
jgi:dihydroneopterin aldolase